MHVLLCAPASPQSGLLRGEVLELTDLQAHALITDRFPGPDGALQTLTGSRGTARILTSRGSFLPALETKGSSGA